MRIERDLSHNYLVPAGKIRYSSDDYQIHMLTENRISGLLKVQVHHMDGMTEFYYDITSRQSIGQKYEKEYMKEEDILSIIRSLYGVIHEIEKYLLNVNDILLDPFTIFWKEEDQNLEFCYLPGQKSTIEDAFLRLSEYILHHLDQTDTKAVLLGYEIYRQASQKKESLEVLLKRGIEDRKMMPAKTEESDRKRQIPQETTPAVFTKEHSLRGKAISKEKTISKERKISKEKTIPKEKRLAKKEKRKPSNYREWILTGSIMGILFAIVITLIHWNYLTAAQGGGIVFLIIGIFGFVLSEQKKETAPEQDRAKSRINGRGSNEDATTVLQMGEEEYQPRLSLIGMNSRERITVILQKDQYLVGKQKSKVDICLNDPAVSRIHARITKEGEEYYVSDMNSTNGTFYNGRRLEAGEKIKLELTDEITFADSGFYVGNS